MARADAASARTDYFAACVALNSFTGLRGTDTICEPSGTALLSRRKINAASLADEAIENRADLQAALKDVTVARRALTVEQKERNMDFEVAVGYNYNTEVRNEIAPAPRFSGMSIGLSIPLKFSNSNKGAVTAARLRVEQAELAYTKACNEIRGEVAVACNSYETAFDILEDYPQSLIATSQDVLGQYSELYSRGDVSLLEYKEMRQSQTDLRTAYIEARTNAAIAAAALDHARGK
ncbi:MAG: TolC family protein, partial [Muribaculaceae bacterium]|nr:TolC family protein [Muribaculaceae bacterium]